MTSSLEVDDDLDSVSSLASLATTVAAVPKDDITFDIMPWAPAPENPNRVVRSAQAEEVFAAINADKPITDLVG